MKFKFPFENVLKHRKVLEDLAQRDFQLVLSEFNSELGKLQKMKDDVHAAHRGAYETQVQGGSAGPALSQVHEFLKLQDVRIERQQLKVQEFEKRVEDLREILRLKAIDYKMIESLKDRKKEAFRIEKNKLEQKKSDEVATLRHIRNLRKEG